MVRLCEGRPGVSAVVPDLFSRPAFVSGAVQQGPTFSGVLNGRHLRMVAPGDSDHTLFREVLLRQVGRLGEGAVTLPGQLQILRVGLAPVCVGMGVDQ